jgi:hypothetical protein
MKQKNSSMEIKNLTDIVKGITEKLTSKQAGVISMIAVGIAGLATGTVYLVNAGLKALSEVTA